MTHSTNTTLGSNYRKSSSPKRRSLVALAALCLCALSTPACNEESSNEGSLGGTQNPASAASVRLRSPYLAGTCTPGATASILGSTNQYLTVIFSNQQYAGDRNSPEYIEERTEGRLIGDAKSTSPKCELHVPMQVTAGYRFSPTNVIIHGFAHRAFVFGAYRWANTAPPNNEYTFERQVPLNESQNSVGDNFYFTEPLHNLWSPTCQKNGRETVDVELIVTIQPYTAAGNDNSIVAIDSFDVAGFGSLEKCDAPPVWDRVAQEGEDCGEVDQDSVHPVRCDTSKQTNVCVYHLTNQRTGTCVNVSKAPGSRSVGRDDECGGPFFKYCDKSQPLVCQFINGALRADLWA